MKVILLKDIQSVGKKYDVKEVAEGHALNFLFPKNLAQMASDANLKRIEGLKQQAASEKAVQEELLAKNLEAINDIHLTIAEKVNEKGHLFAAVHEQKIAEEVKNKAHIDILPDFISLPRPIKEAGEYDVHVNVKDKKATFKLTVEALGE